MVSDLCAGAGPSNPSRLAQLGSVLLLGTDDCTRGDELWKVIP
jgi:hypothetical protein